MGTICPRFFSSLSAPVWGSLGVLLLLGGARFFTRKKPGNSKTEMDGKSMQREGGMDGEGADPMERHRALIAARIGAYERERGSVVLPIIHHDRDDYVDRDTSMLVLDTLRAAGPDRDVDVVLHTPGGEGAATRQILHALKRHKGRKTAFIPYHAWSAGTMIALACDEIVMSPSAVLGPIDPQYGYMPAAILAQLLKEKNKDRISDEMFVLAKMAERAVREARHFACEYTNPAHKDGDSCAITDELVSGARNHDYPIVPEEARELGLNVKNNIPEAIYAICEPPPEEAGILTISMFSNQKQELEGKPATLPDPRNFR